MRFFAQTSLNLPPANILYGYCPKTPGNPWLYGVSRGYTIRAMSRKGFNLFATYNFSKPSSDICSGLHVMLTDSDILSKLQK